MASPIDTYTALLSGETLNRGNCNRDTIADKAITRPKSFPKCSEGKASVRKAALHPYRKERLTTCRMKVAYWSSMTGMEAHRVKPRDRRDVRASEGTMEQRATASEDKPGPEGKRGACKYTQGRAGKAKRDQN